MFKKIKEWLEYNLIPLLLTALIAVLLFYINHKFVFYL